MVGDNLVTWLWGGLSVDLATLNRFFSLHYLLPVIILGSSIVHIGTLHHYGSSNPLGIAKPVDAGAFFTYLGYWVAVWSSLCLSVGFHGLELRIFGLFELVTSV